MALFRCSVSGHATAGHRMTTSTRRARGRRRAIVTLTVPLVLGLAAIAAPGWGASSVTARVSVSSAGAEADGRSFGPSISVGGRFVAFSSDASNLVAGDTNDASDVFVRDRRDGATERVSLGAAGEEG